MSKRRKAGDIVWLKPYSGFVEASYQVQAEIQPEEEGYREYCHMCDDPNCVINRLMLN